MMELHLAEKTIIVPDEIYLDQLIQLDLGQLEQIQNMDLTKLSNSSEMLRWVLQFLKVMGIKDRLTLKDFQKLNETQELNQWFEHLFAGFLPSS